MCVSCDGVDHGECRVVDTYANTKVIRTYDEPERFQETFSYMESRITDCGGQAGLFTQGALKLIHQASVGLLRTVGTIATSAMMKAYHANSPGIYTARECDDTWHTNYRALCSRKL